MNLASAQNIAVLIYGSSKLEVWDVEENKTLGHLQRRGKRNVEIAIRGVILRRVNGINDHEVVQNRRTGRFLGN